MGAWGTGIFEDDSTCDMLYEAIETDAVSFISSAIEQKSSDYLGHEECSEIIVAGAIMDMLINGTQYAHHDEEFDEWISSQSNSNLTNLKTDIVKCLNKVISDKSELNELWLENEESYPNWKNNIESIIKRLGT